MLTFIKDYGVEKGRKVGLYRCDCGNLTTVANSRVLSGNTKSCGCLRAENARTLRNNKMIKNTQKEME